MLQKRVKVGSLIYGHGTVVVYHVFNDGVNPFWVYFEACYKDNKHTYPTKHRKCINKCRSLSCAAAEMHSIVENYERS